MAEEQIQISIVAEDFIKDWPILNRTKNSLVDNGIFTLSDIQKLYLEDLKELPGLGQKGLLEIREFLYLKYKFCFKRRPKERKIDNISDCKEVVTHLLGSNVKDWPRQIKCASQLLQLYNKEILLRVKSPPHIYSLVWFLNKDYGASYIKKFIPVTMIPETPYKQEIPQEQESIDFVPRFNSKPRNLKDFLNV